MAAKTDDLSHFSVLETLKNKQGSVVELVMLLCSQVRGEGMNVRMGVSEGAGK